MEKNKEYIIGNTYLCKVIATSKNFFKVQTTNDQKGVVFIKEISDYFVPDLNKFIQEKDILYLTLKEIRENGTLVFSFKENKSRFLKMPFDFNLESQETDEQKNSFQKLFDFTNKEIKKWKK